MRLSDKKGARIRKKPRVSSARRPNEEVEVKLRVPDRRLLLARLADLGAVCSGRVHEMNTLYDTRNRTLMRKGQLLRIRTERPANRPGMHRASKGQTLEGALLTYKGPVRHGDSSASRRGRRYKVREEREVRIADGEEFALILEAVGLRPSFRYEKYRSTYRLPGTGDALFELDETPVGDFLEVEGTRAAINRGAKLLGYGPSDYVIKSYWDLFQESMRKSGHTKSSKRERFPTWKPRDMLFPSAR